MTAILAELAIERPVFHSEADFQHALAWQLHKHYPHTSVRLEYPVILPGTLDPIHVDIWWELPQGSAAIELKYITHKLTVNVDKERFILKNHAAQNLRSYDVVKDIVRLERLIEAGACSQGYACVLTNETYWQPPRFQRNAQVDPFRLYEGRELSGSLGNLKAREVHLHLTGTHKLHWQEYSDVAPSAGKFCYLLVSLK